MQAPDSPGFLPDWEALVCLYTNVHIAVDELRHQIMMNPDHGKETRRQGEGDLEGHAGREQDTCPAEVRPDDHGEKG